MTNREKFEEVFGIKIDLLADDPCNIVDDRYCSIDYSGFRIKNKKCSNCEMNHFWDKEYIETSEDHKNISKAFMLGALFVTVASRDQVINMIMKMMEDMEGKEDE